MRHHLFFSLLLVCILVGLCSCTALPPATGDAFSYASAAGGDCGVFMTLTNPSGQPDTLVAVKTDVAAQAELHTVVGDMKSGMKMQQVESIPLPASGTVELKPGSLHIMLFGLNKETKAGDTFALTLQYESGREQSVQVQVRPKN